MARRKKKSNPNYGARRIGLLALLVGALLGFGASQLAPAKLTPETCAHRIADIGGPNVAIAYVCYGKSLQDIASGQ